MKAVLTILQMIVFVVTAVFFIENAALALDAASRARAGALVIRAQMVSESLSYARHPAGAPAGYQVWK